LIDIHHHLLFGLDDGSPDIETSVAMAEAAAADGTTHIVCTPHSNDKYRFRPEVNLEKVTALRERLGDRITLGLGCDFHLSYDNVADALQNPTKYTINGTQYLLVEFPDFGIAPNMSETFYQLELKRMTPIITHPERNPTLVHQPERLAEWLRNGCLIQVTAGALLGRFGKNAEQFANTMLRKNWVHFLASDGHNLTSRPPQMSKAHSYLANHYGEEMADRLCIHNPRAVFNGDAWPDQPEPTGLYPDDDRELAKKRSFLGRFFSK
jgi:protein-tyrosine phosphatase